jgi:RHS repeat-associated protein
VGNVVTVVDPNGTTNEFGYDATNREVSILYADGSAVSYVYDADGRRATMVDSHGTTMYAYDALNRLTSVTNPEGQTVTYGYDAVGNRNSLTYPDGKVVSYSYNAVNRLAGVTDWLARTTTYSYDSANNLTAIAYPNKAAISFGFDGANRLTSVVNTMRSLPSVAISYSLDAVGNRTKETVAGVTTTFAYDPLNELVSAQLGPLKNTWSYDAVGNRVALSSPIGSIAYSYDAADRLLSAGLSTFGYDSNGNRITWTSGRLTWAYTYDSANRLVKELGYGIDSTFGYDGDGKRVSQTNGTGSYSYLNDVATALPVVLNEEGPDGDITYAYGRGLIEESSATFNYFYHYDGLGSVVGLTDASGKPQAAYAYDLWGNALLTVTDSVGTKNKFRFTGQALDPGTGLYYLRARYYDPTVGRLISRDPFSGRVGFPSTQNRFGYANNNPLRFADPTGLSAEPATGDMSTSGVPPSLFPQAPPSFYESFFPSGPALLPGGGSTIPPQVSPGAIALPTDCDPTNPYSWCSGSPSQMPPTPPIVSSGTVSAGSLELYMNSGPQPTPDSNSEPIPGQLPWSTIQLYSAPDSFAPVGPGYIPLPPDIPLYEAPDYYAPVVPDLGGNESGGA